MNLVSSYELLPLLFYKIFVRLHWFFFIILNIEIKILPDLFLYKQDFLLQQCFMYLHCRGCHLKHALSFKQVKFFLEECSLSIEITILYVKIVSNGYDFISRHCCYLLFRNYERIP